MIAPNCITFLLNPFLPDHTEIEQNESWNNFPPLSINEEFHDTIDILLKPGVIFTQPFTKAKHLTDSKLYAENTARDYINKLCDLQVLEKKVISGHHYLNLPLKSWRQRKNYLISNRTGRQELTPWVRVQHFEIYLKVYTFVVY